MVRTPYENAECSAMGFLFFPRNVEFSMRLNGSVGFLRVKEIGNLMGFSWL